jgi:hypothetical protein
LERSVAGRVARLAEVGVRIDFVTDTGCLVGEILGSWLAPVIATAVIRVDGTLAAAVAHFIDDVCGIRGDGTGKVSFAVIGVGEAVDAGRWADRIRHATNWEGVYVSGYCDLQRVVDCGYWRTLSIDSRRHDDLDWWQHVGARRVVMARVNLRGAVLSGNDWIMLQIAKAYGERRVGGATIDYAQDQ